MRCAVKCCVFIEIYGEFETFSASSAPSGHLLLKEKALVCANLKQSNKSEVFHFPYFIRARTSGINMFVDSYRAWFYSVVHKESRSCL